MVNMNASQNGDTAEWRQPERRQPKGRQPERRQDLCHNGDTIFQVYVRTETKFNILIVDLFKLKQRNKLTVYTSQS